jgi:hypothetical protein
MICSVATIVAANNSWCASTYSVRVAEASFMESGSGIYLTPAMSL